VFHVKDETAFVLRPNVLHACISLSLSSHLGGWLWELSEYRDSLRMVEWGLDWLRAKARGPAPIGDYIGEFHTIKSEVEAWQNLLKDNPNEKESKELKRILKGVQSKTAAVRKVLKM
jgi:hypothetical protein